MVDSGSEPVFRAPSWFCHVQEEQPRHAVLTDVLVGLVLMLTVGLPLSINQNWQIFFDWRLLASWVPFTLAIITRRTCPWPSLVLLTFGFNIKLLVGAPPSFGDIAILMVLFSCAANGSRLRIWLSGIMAVVFPLLEAVYLALFPVDIPGLRDFAGAGFYGSSAFFFSLLIFSVPLVLGTVVVWLAGMVQRVQIQAHQLTHSAELAEIEYQRTQEQLIVEQERNRIARDMHDVVAHSLAVVVAQADGGRYLMKADPNKAEPVLSTISETAREALADVRGLLGQLRHTQGEGPSKGIDDIPAVLDRIRAAGLRVDVNVVGVRKPIGAIAELAVFRVVQEALTNALKYGDNKTPTALEIRWEDKLYLIVRNRVADVPKISASGGHGIIGMRERLLAVGGEASAGMEGCEWVVRAQAPYVSPAANVECDLPTDPESYVTGEHEPVRAEIPPRVEVTHATHTSTQK
ncbi:sensor histidine kinase [Gulosibacter molinativorax]|uniref:histidine kinase n=1 Tax=Gulosibacter molinativorax TaxID=256821 RepID=A0ABT7C3H9_9MICO|nr:sensor histidine kinase [Gulosibacter molinativorax]